MDQFDPFSQNVTLLDAEQTPFNITMLDLEAFDIYNIRICINYASQLGASLLLLVVLVVLSKPDRRQSFLFILNCFSLGFNFIRSLLQCLYFTGGFNSTYAYFAADYSRVSASDYAVSICSDVFTLMVLICIELSLLMQVRVVCVTMTRFHQFVIMSFTGLVAIMAIGFRFALVVENAKSILAAADFTPFVWLASGTNIIATISICIFCAIFTVKLGFALYQRKKLGLRQFGPMQVIFIMGCQTMVIPALFSILQYISQAPELGSNVLTLTAIFLPLSSIWASFSLDHNTQQSSQPPSGNSGKQKLINSTSSSFASAGRTEKGGGGGGDPLRSANSTSTSDHWSPAFKHGQSPYTDKGNVGGTQPNRLHDPDGIHVSHDIDVREFQR